MTDYKQLTTNYSLEKDKLKSSIELIAKAMEAKQISYSIITEDIKLTKSQYYFSIYNYFLDQGYILKDTIVNELLLKLTSRDKFQDINLPYEETDELLAFVILYFNYKETYSFADQILKINADNFQLDYFMIQHVMSSIIPIMKISNEDLVKILNHFAQQAENDFTVGEVYTACQNYCVNNADQGFELLDYMVENNETRFMINAILGVSENDFEKVYEYLRGLFENKYKIQSIIAFGYLNYSEKENIDEVIEILSDVVKTSEDNQELSACAMGISSLLHNKLIEENELEDRIFSLIDTLLKKEIAEVNYNIINTFMRVNYSDRYLDRKIVILPYYYNVSFEHKGIIFQLSHFLKKVRKPEIVLDFIRYWIINHTNLKNLDDFNYPLKSSYKEYSRDFIFHYAKLIIDPKGRVRKEINDIFKLVKLSDENKEHWLETFKKMNSQEHKLLFRSLSNYSIDIEEKLKVTTLLVKVCDINVFHFLLQEYVWLVHDYGGMICDVTNIILDMDEQKEKKFYNVLKEKSDEITSIWAKKQEIKELDPAINQARYFTKFYELYYKKQNDFLANYKSDRTPLLNMISKVPIGRGAGFKIGEKDEIGKFTKFESSFPVPRSLLIYPESFNYKWIKTMNEDWEKDNV